MADPAGDGIARGPRADKPALSARGSQHVPECQEYRRLYLGRYGVLTHKVCCCARVAAEHDEST